VGLLDVPLLAAHCIWVHPNEIAPWPVRAPPWSTTRWPT
jgi:hypothetical protein